MVLTPAVEADYAAIIELANVAYRKTGPGSSWNSESGLMGGPRLNESLLRRDLEARGGAELLVYRDETNGILGGTVWLEPKGEDVWYLGLLTVRPDLQNQHMGRNLLAAAEDFVRERGGRRIRMNVLSARDTLIAWYERRGYALTGEAEPIPKAGEHFLGIPLKEGLYFAVMVKDI